jgi:hypothetical protein
MADDKEAAAEPEAPVSKRPKRCPEKRYLESSTFQDFIERCVSLLLFFNPWKDHTNTKSRVSKHTASSATLSPPFPSPLSFLPIHTKRRLSNSTLDCDAGGKVLR